MRMKPDIAAEVTALSNLSRDELVECWCKIYGVAPPKGVRQELMIRAVAWHLQARRLGGLSAETRRLLRSGISRVEKEILALDTRQVPLLRHRSMCRTPKATVGRRLCRHRYASGDPSHPVRG